MGLDDCGGFGGWRKPKMDGLRIVEGGRWRMKDEEGLWIVDGGWWMVGVGEKSR